MGVKSQEFSWITAPEHGFKTRGLARILRDPAWHSAPARHVRPQIRSFSVI